MSRKIRVLCVDDNADVCEALCLAIEGEADMESVGAVHRADGLGAVIADRRPDVVLLDLTMPGRDPLEAIEELGRAVGGARVLVVSGYDDGGRVGAAARRGASGFVSKDVGVEELLKAIRRVSAGERVGAARGT